MKKETVTSLAFRFKRKYPMTVAWRIKQNASIVEQHLNPGETPLYVFVAQKEASVFQFFQTAVVALTNKRILIGRNRVVVGYFLDGITPDLFNDLKVTSGILWGKVIIDTAKEEVTFSHIGKKALTEIETNITEYMMKEKRKYKTKEVE